MRPIDILPALDVRRGRSVRPGPGGELIPDADPEELARCWAAAGTPWIHLVDLDAAFGSGDNVEILRRIVETTTVRVQLSGGIRTAASLARGLELAPARVVLATDALTDRAWVEQAVGEHGDRIVVGLDVSGTRLVARGSGVDAGELAAALGWLEAAGARRYVVTEVAGDRSLGGPPLELLARVAGLTERPLLASGGVASVADIVRLRQTPGVEGVVLGTALMTGQVRLDDAIAAAGSDQAPSDEPSDAA